MAIDLNEEVQMSQDEFDDFLALLEEAEANTANSWEEDFVSDMRAKADEYGRRVYVSDRQMEILQRIADDA